MVTFLVIGSHVAKNWYSSVSKRASLIAQLVRICLQCKRPWFNPWVRKICWRRDRLPTLVFLGFPCGSAGAESSCNVGNLGLIPGLGSSPREEKGYPLQYSGLENSRLLLFPSSLCFCSTWLHLFHLSVLHFKCFLNA